MATYSNPELISATAACDMSSYQYHCISIDTDGKVGLVSASYGGKWNGILWNDPDTAGLEATIAVRGDAKVAASATSAITIGAMLAANTTGKAYPATAGTDETFGFALEALASGSGIIRVYIMGLNDPS
ncbi:MAG: DUF2190 family protein [Sphaerochaeta sp.]|jgi:hypothetical protein|nr:DUF2190 family protein [Sphaerochaeta sp.]